MENDQFKLPENAQRELKPGEEYEPILSKNKRYQEVTVWSVCIGLLMTILFSAAAAYLGLKVGQVFEAAIPIAIIAIGLTGLARKNDALSQNVIIQSIGGCSGGVVAGAIFTLPALYILQGKGYQIEINFWQVFIASLLGGILGILFLIPFRKYFVKEQHGKFPFPEATATTQVLVSGQKKGKDSLLLVVSGLIGGLYDFIVSTFGWWSETITTRMMGWGAAMADKAKLMFKVNTGAAVLGLGYIIGLKYAFIICCGSLLVWFIIIPGMNLIWGDQIIDLMNTGVNLTIGEMSPEQIFKDYARHIGIGGIAMAGIISIIKSWGVIKSSVSLAANEFKGKKGPKEVVERTQQDIPMKYVVIGIVAVLIITFLFFWLFVVHNVWHALIGILVVAVIAFLFTTVAANAIAIVGSDPDDPDPCLHRDGRCRSYGTTRNERHLDHRWCGLHGLGCGRSLHHRFESGLLDWHNAQETRALEVHRRSCRCCHCGWCHHDLEQGLRFRGRRRPSRSSSQRHVGRHRAHDVGRQRTLAALWHRCRHRIDSQLLQGTGFAFRLGYVHPH